MPALTQITASTTHGSTTTTS